MFAKIVPLLFVFVLQFASVASQDKQMKLRIMSYNVRHAAPALVARTVKKHNPDLVALQEIDKNNGRSGIRADQAKEIAKKLKMNYEFFKAIDFSGGEYGIVILSKYPIKSTKKVDLPGEGEHRVLGTAYIDLGRGKEMVFANTHMDPFISQDAQLQQMKTIIDALSVERSPVVLAGDLNSETGSPIINFLDQHFTRVCNSECLPTYPNINPHAYIDHIAFRKTDPFTVSRYAVPDEPQPSDHLPVLADLFLKE